MTDMNDSHLTGIKTSIYHTNGKFPLVTCQPDHLGFMGVFLKGIHLDYPEGTPLEIEIQKNKSTLQEHRVSMILDKNTAKGTGLRLNTFDTEVVTSWKNALTSLLGSESIL